MRDSGEVTVRGRWIGLIAASAGMFLGTLDITVNVALPNITSSFGTDAQTVQWVIIFYVGSTTSLQLGLGGAADLYGLKRFYLIGLATYTVAVFLIGLAPYMSWMIGLRVLQAVGNGLILASAPALVTSLFPPEQRGRALGLMAGLGTLGMIVGSLGGGVLVDAFGWRSIFLFRVPLGVGALALAYVALRDRRYTGLSTGFDSRGAVTLFLGLASFILLLTLGGRTGWTTTYVWGLGLISVLSFATFSYVETRARRPVLELSLLKHRVLSPVMIAAFLMSFATFVNWFILPFFASDILMVNAKTLGVLLMLTPVLASLSAPAGGLLSDRIPPAYLTTLALVVISGSLFWFSSLDSDSTVTDVAYRMAAIGFGMGLFQAANATMIMGTVSPDRLGTGGAFIALSRSMGVVTSVAVMGAVFAGRMDSHESAFALQGMLPDEVQGRAFVLAFRDTYLVSGILSALGILVSFAYWPRIVKSRPAASRETRSAD